MIARVTTLAALATAAMLPLMAAQTANAADSAAKPMFMVLPPHGGTIHANRNASLATWTGTIHYNNNTYNFRMVGTDPSNTNTTTTVTAYLIPIEMVYSKKVYGSSHHKFNPNVDQQNGVSITQNILNSPLFNNVDWVYGGTDVGTEQYVDGYQRASFWTYVGSTNTNYHVTLAPTVLTEQVINVTKAQGGNVVNNPFGGSGKVGLMNINSFDQQLQSFIAHFSQINPSNVAIFITDNIYLTSGGCCIGGYHSANGNGQTYMTATYAYSPGAFVFSEDISAFSHEIGEWYDDPLITSRSPCGLLENGDPLEGKANYGDFNVNFGGVTWHPQTLAMMEYFGDPANFSVNNWLDNQNIEKSVCENGQ